MFRTTMRTQWPFPARRLSFSIVSFVFAVVPTGVTIGCASSTASSPRSPGSVVEVPRVVVSPYSDAELAQQFEQARALLLRDQFRDAVSIFDRVARMSPSSELTPPSLFNAGVAYEALGERETAIQRFAEVSKRFPGHETAKNAMLRTARLAAYLERWDDLVTIANDVLARRDLTILDTVEAHGLEALGLVERNDVEGAGKHAAIAMDLIEQNRLGDAGRPPMAMAPAVFALGEVRRRKSEAIVFDPLPPNFADALEQRCQGLLDAQSAYTEAMRSLDAHWSAMAGYRVGQLYQELHRDVMQIKAPPSADTPERKSLFEGAMRLRYRVLLEKGLKMMDATVRLGERTGENSSWVAKASQAKRDLEVALEEEKAALAKLPFSEKELQAGLDSLRDKKTKPPK